jgi:hypothetical protein
MRGWHDAHNAIRGRPVPTDQHHQMVSAQGLGRESRPPKANKTRNYRPGARRLYVLDLWRRQTASNVWVEVLCDLIKRWKPIARGEEAGQIRAGIGPFLDQRLRERRAYVARKSFPARGNKETRAQSIRGRMALDGIYLPASAQVTAGAVLGAEPVVRGDFGNAPPAPLALRQEGGEVPLAPNESAIVPTEYGPTWTNLPPCGKNGSRPSATSCCTFRTGATTIRSMR